MTFLSSFLSIITTFNFTYEQVRSFIKHIIFQKGNLNFTRLNIGRKANIPEDTIIVFLPYSPIKVRQSPFSNGLESKSLPRVILLPEVFNGQGGSTPAHPKSLVENRPHLSSEGAMDKQVVHRLCLVFSQDTSIWNKKTSFT